MSKKTRQILKWEGIDRNLSKDIPKVFNQKGEGICLAVTLADLVGTINRKYGNAGELQLSPQPLIDALRFEGPQGDQQTDKFHASSFEDIENFCCDTECGFESVETYPFILTQRDKWNQKEYSDIDFKKYIVEKIVSYSGEAKIKNALIRNFRAGRSKYYPMIGEMFTGDFEKKEVAKKHYSSRFPYKHGDNYEPKPDEPPHVLLIVWLNTMDEDKRKHYCLVKNSYGRRWGYNGLSKVSPEAFTVVYAAQYNYERITALFRREKNKKEGKDVIDETETDDDPPSDHDLVSSEDEDESHDDQFRDESLDKKVVESQTRQLVRRSRSFSSCTVHNDGLLRTQIDSPCSTSSSKLSQEQSIYSSSRRANVGRQRPAQFQYAAQAPPSHGGLTQKPRCGVLEYEESDDVDETKSLKEVDSYWLEDVEKAVSKAEGAIGGNSILRCEVQNTINNVSSATRKMKDLDIKVSQERNMLREEVQKYSEKNMLLTSEVDMLKKKVEALEEVVDKRGADHNPERCPQTAV